MKFTFALSFLCLLSVTSGLPNFHNFNTEDYDHEFVEVNPSKLDDKFKLNTRAFGQKYSLNLKKLPDIFHENFKMMSLELDKNGQPTMKQVHQKSENFHIYEDPYHGSILHVSHNPEDKTVQLEGLITPDLAILPARQERSTHIVMKSKNLVEKRISNNNMPTFKHLTKRNAEINSTAELPDVITAELVVVMDYKNCMTLKFDSEKIKKYLSIFWNAVNRRFAMLDKPKIQLSLLSAVMIMDKRLQPYIENSRVHSNGKNFVDYFKVWEGLSRDMYKKFHNNSKFDIAMLMTGEKLADKLDSGEYDTTQKGIAIVGGACDWDDTNQLANNIGLAEDVAPFYNGVLYHAHEIGHLLGATHDGDPPMDHLPGMPSAEGCPWKDGWLMSYRVGFSRHFHFSNCSVDQIHWFLKSGNSSCLFTVNGGRPKIPLKSQLPGELVSLDNQCITTGRPGSIAYPSQDKSSLCEVLYCIDKFGRVSNNGPALEGTKCGYIGEKWCINGVCTRKN